MTRSRLMTSPLGEPWPCESGHCGKDNSGQYPTAKLEAVYLDEDAYSEDDEWSMGVCDICVNPYRWVKKTQTKTILRVVRLVSQVHPLESF